MLTLIMESHLFNLSFPASQVLTFIFTLTIIFIGIVIFFENGDPSKTLAWFLVLVFFPVFGFILYLLIGRKFGKIRRYQSKEAESFHQLTRVMEDDQPSIEKGQHYIYNHIPHKRKLINLIANTARSPFTVNNKTTLFSDGKEAFASMLKVLEMAKDHIHLEFYRLK